MKKSVFITEILLLLLVISCASAYTPDELKADDAFPVIEDIQIYKVQEHVNEITWWISDNLELGRYEIYKNGVLIKTKPIGGIRQSSKFQDLQSWGTNNYTFVVFDAAGHSVEKNLTIDGMAPEETAQSASTAAQPEEEQVIITAPTPELYQETSTPPETPPVTEEPALEESSTNVLAVIIVLIVLAVLWKVMTMQQNKKKSPNQRKYESMGMHTYLEKRSKPRPKPKPKKRKE